MSKTIKIFSPATVANIGCGFDVLGFALEKPGDVISVSLTDTPGSIVIRNEIANLNIPLDPARNTTTVALQAYLDFLKTDKHTGTTASHFISNHGIEVIFHEKIKPGSGLGSSSASAAAGVFGLNVLLGNPLKKSDLVQFAMQGESAACGVAHADNVAPAVLGGFVLVRSYMPLDVVALPYPDNLFVAIVHPQIEILTEDARKILPELVPLKDAVRQWGNVAGLVAGLAKGDHTLIGRSLQDVIVEPVRATLISGYYEAKQAAMTAGALGGNISGSGPSMFAFCSTFETAEAVAKAFAETFNALGIENQVYVSGINKEGVRVIAD